MFDVFYSGIKPNQFAHEREAESIEHAQSMCGTRYFWWITYLCDYSEWDWLWEPVPWQSNQRHAWASQWQKDSGTYLVPRSGYTDTNYHDAPIILRVHSDNVNWTVPEGIEAFDVTWHPDPTEPVMTYQFGTQHQRTGGPRYHNGGTLIKYVDTPRAVKISQDSYWTIPDGADTDSFDWTWHPDATDPPYTYQFGTQHQRTGGPQYHVPGAKDTKFVGQLVIRTNRVATAIYEIDHMDGAAGAIPNTTRRVRYFDNYRDTLIRLARSIGPEHEFVWICSSICDYTNFDFSWHPEQWQAGMLHVFASDGEKFGDTFFMHVPSFAHRAEQVALLEWYDCNFVGINVPRRPIPVITHALDSQAKAVRTLDWAGPLALFTTTDYVLGNLVTVPLWRENVKTVVPLSAGAASVIVPRTAVPYVKTQLYDYPYIDRTHRMLKDQPLDIVFIDNGERDADSNFTHLNSVTYNLENRLHRSSGATGRVAAYHAAAEMSTTPWFFAVFAKLQVDQNFDWSWQPDRMQQAKHYIFHAKNPVNGLVYGHQAMIAYNRRLTLANTGHGLDFTLDDPHEVVPIVSGSANYYTSSWMCWRTAFREVLKLRASLPDIENEYRLNQWLTKDNTLNQWSIKGAQDAVEYYESVNGDFEQLRKSYEWAWLATHALIKRGLTTDP